jgi:hypothetical protein
MKEYAPLLESPVLSGSFVPDASGSRDIGTQALAFNDINANLMRADYGYFTNLSGAGVIFLAPNGNGSSLTGIPRTKTLLWYIKGDAAVLANTSARIDVNFAGTITKARAYSKTAPTGADLTFDINKNASTIWSNQADRLKVAASATTGSTTTFNTTTFVANDYFTIDIDVIGSSVAGADITVELETTVTG